MALNNVINSDESRTRYDLSSTKSRSSRSVCNDAGVRCSWRIFRHDRIVLSIQLVGENFIGIKITSLLKNQSEVKLLQRRGVVKGTIADVVLARKLALL
jgi:hypothetical protein